MSSHELYIPVSILITFLHDILVSSGFKAGKLARFRITGMEFLSSPDRCHNSAKSSTKFPVQVYGSGVAEKH